MPKNVKLGIIICIVLVLGLGGVAIYQNAHKDDNLVKTVDRNLSQADRDTYTGRISAAQDSLDKSSNTDDKFNSYMTLAVNNYGLGQLEEAKKDYNEAVKLKPDTPTGYTGLFAVDQEMKDNAGAEAAIQKAISLQPANAGTWRQYIEFEKDVMHKSNAEINDLYVQALGKTSNSVDVMTVYAEFLGSDGNLESAKEYWQKAIAANPAGKDLYQKEIDRL
ncbi:MAG TPA: tetratricopeptide repeat protein, partial [Patescibacteria group bacterium]|nr:tetratricopeptide repeat protein [Patescibacteria group bacterium]